MAMSKNKNDREFDSYEENAIDGGTDRRVTIKGGLVTVDIPRLNTGGLVTIVPLNAATWTPLPATPLANRKALSLQNTSGTLIKLNYNPSTVGFVGVELANNQERMYDITNNIIVYAKAESGTPSITVEELA